MGVAESSPRRRLETLRGLFAGSRPEAGTTERLARLEARLERELTEMRHETIARVEYLERRVNEVLARFEERLAASDGRQSAELARFSAELQQFAAQSTDPGHVAAWLRELAARIEPPPAFEEL